MGSVIGKFIAALKHPEPGQRDFEIKKTVIQGSQWEQLWLSDMRFVSGHFQGRVDDKPRNIGELKLVQAVSVNPNQISDWLYVDNGHWSEVKGYGRRLRGQPSQTVATNVHPLFNRSPISNICASANLANWTISSEFWIKFLALTSAWNKFPRTAFIRPRAFSRVAGLVDGILTPAAASLLAGLRALRATLLPVGWANSRIWYWLRPSSS